MTDFDQALRSFTDQVAEAAARSPGVTLESIDASLIDDDRNVNVMADMSDGATTISVSFPLDADGWGPQQRGITEASFAVAAGVALAFGNLGG